MGGPGPGWSSSITDDRSGRGPSPTRLPGTLPSVAANGAATLLWSESSTGVEPFDPYAPAILSAQRRLPGRPFDPTELVSGDVPFVGPVALRLDPHTNRPLAAWTGPIPLGLPIPTEPPLLFVGSPG